MFILGKAFIKEGNGRRGKAGGEKEEKEEEGEKDAS